ncbi:MAG: peroxiredoxin family protein [Dehalococcoidales bacterium]|jgi:peroxiredoxin Q/BCP|nr:peroxiredoxin family protein [Dehalococcoidales bacterium]
MAQLRRDIRKFTDRETEVIAVGPENAPQFKTWWDEHEMPFIGIPDPDHIIADRYGQQSKLIKMGRLPASVLVDKYGRIRYSRFGDSMADIPETEEMLAIIDALNKGTAGQG